MKFLIVLVAVIGLAAAQQCTPDQFECRNGLCIPGSWKCDGDNDCGDMSDEEGCPTRPTTQCPGFTCANDGRCIPASWVCDGDNDCGDMSDETWVPGFPGFQCPNGRCVGESRVCDGRDDCGDGSDETEEACPCADNEMRCSQPPGSNVPGPCIPPEWVCDEDGIWDCPDGSDEKDCDIKKPHHPRAAVHHFQEQSKRRSSLRTFVKLMENQKLDAVRRKMKAEANYAYKNYRPQPKNKKH